MKFLRFTIFPIFKVYTQACPHTPSYKFMAYLLLITVFVVDVLYTMIPQERAHGLCTSQYSFKQEEGVGQHYRASTLYTTKLAKHSM